MKKYKNSEVFKALEENNKLRFVSQDGIDERRELFVSDGGYFLIKYFKGNEHVKDVPVRERFDGNIGVHTTWKLIPREVTFMEAVKAFGEGETIRCETKVHADFRYSPIRYTNPSTGQIPVWQILEGKWYIEG